MIGARIFLPNLAWAQRGINRNSFGKCLAGLRCRRELQIWLIWSSSAGPNLAQEASERMKSSTNCLQSKRPRLLEAQPHNFEAQSQNVEAQPQNNEVWFQKLEAQPQDSEEPKPLGTQKLGEGNPEAQPRHVETSKPSPATSKPKQKYLK